MHPPCTLTRPSGESEDESEDEIEDEIEERK